jgi:hypothetical protein
MCEMKGLDGSTPAPLRQRICDVEHSPQNRTESPLTKVDTYNISTFHLERMGAAPTPSRCHSGGLHSDDCLFPKEAQRAHTADLKTITKQHEQHVSPG